MAENSYEIHNVGMGFDTQRRKSVINEGTDDEMTIWGYKKDRWKQIAMYCASFLTLGLVNLVLYWLPRYRIKITHRKCHLKEATSLLLQDQYKQWFVSEVMLTTPDGTRIKIVQERQTSRHFSCKKSKRNLESYSLTDYNSDSSIIKYFLVKKVKYVWNNELGSYERLKGLEHNTYCSSFHDAICLTMREQAKKRVLYGLNSIKVSVTPVLVLLVKEVLSPFYCFQVFSMSVWYSDEYYIYATCILVISSVSICVSIYQTRMMQKALRNTIQASSVVTVMRDGEYQDIPSEDLVPGDIIEIPRQGCIMQCDTVLVAGNCIVDESMLTGESVPVTKTPLPDNRKGGAGEGDTMFDMKEHARHVLFCGTHVIQTRFYGSERVRGVVIRTGFSTAKGELVRSILYPKPVDFKFERDTYIFVGILAIISALGFIYTIVLEIHHGEDTRDIAVHALDIITITVPPALPAALTVGILFAQRRLKKQGIYCISPRSINISGSLNVACFDKTGTLTEDGLNMQGVIPVQDSQFQEEIKDMPSLSSGHVKVAMATCHSLTKIDGKLSGDPLDLIMFNSLEWELHEPGEEESRFDMMAPTIVYPSSTPDVLKNTVNINEMEEQKEEYGIVRQFTFTSSLQRMSVVVRKLGSPNFDLYCKGAPETVAGLCRPDTVPENFYETLTSYTQHGYRVLGLAYKPLSSKIKFVKIQRMQREQVEKDLIFIGLLIMENKLKPETLPIIHQLREANVRTVMVTGDNILTALSVARECGMVHPSDDIILVEAFMCPKTFKPKIDFVCANDHMKSLEPLSNDQDVAVQIAKMSDSYHFAITGKSWATLYDHFEDLLPKIVVKGTVFARMSPNQKAQLVEMLQDVGYYVSMCGDGANDCGALKAAHTGISLSEAEASVASPFTSKIPNISCVPTVISEGRAALVTSFGIFKYMACYSLTQFVSVCILYSIGANLTDYEFLYTDLVLVSTISITFGRTEAYPKLDKEPPPFRLTHFLPVASLIFQVVIQTTFQVLCFFNIKAQSWFEPYVENPDDDYRSYENSAVFYMSAYQYIILGITFAKGAPYRKSMLTNRWFLINVIAITLLTSWLTLYPTEPVAEFFELKPAESFPYRFLYLGMAGANFVISLLVEMFVLDSMRVRRKCAQLTARCFPSGQQKYKAIEEAIEEDDQWPPLNPSSLSLDSHFRRLDSQIPAMEVKSECILPPDTDTESLKSQPTTPRKSVSSSFFVEDDNISENSVEKPLLMENCAQPS